MAPLLTQSLKPKTQGSFWFWPCIPLGHLPIHPINQVYLWHIYETSNQLNFHNSYASPSHHDRSPRLSHSILIGLPVSTLTKHWLNSILCPAQFFFIKTIKSPPSANLCFPLAFHCTYNEIRTPISPTVLPVTSSLIQLNTKPLALSQNHRAHFYLRLSSRSNCCVIPGTRFPRSSCSLSSLNPISLQ